MSITRPMAPNATASPTPLARTDSSSVSEAPRPSELDSARLAYTLWQQPPAAEVISPAAIAQLAYVLWQQRGCPQGSAERDWWEAEQRLRESSVPLTPERPPLSVAPVPLGNNIPERNPSFG